MFVIVKVPAEDTSAKIAEMKDLLAPRPAGCIPDDMRVNGCERERLDAIDALSYAVRYAVFADNVKDEMRCHDCGDDISYAHKLRLEHPEFVLGAETVIRKLMEVKKDVPFVKEFINGLYGVNSLRGTDNNGKPDPAGHDAASAENVKDETRDIFVTVNSDHVNHQAMHEVAKLIAVLSDTDRDIHVNII